MDKIATAIDARIKEARAEMARLEAARRELIRRPPGRPRGKGRQRARTAPAA